MAWKAEKPDGWTLFGHLLPLIVLFLVIGGFSFVGYQIYLSVKNIRTQATKNIGNKNITFTKDGMRVGVKHLDSEHYVDVTQRVFVDAWNKHGEGRQR
ncbi:hypothetical protein CMQ_1974 [Grosmannia clavigera kw1407]|uniref:Uncharacterized protein n=1 Tax=Grosmannia clavigera (strain kw1407 / UAMH 11150) TaxID=655863 RepID=F0XNG1_GROCL|nr:uncharacterized protein CMQ_1974 [Grosmannia clavigera kw1407]EFX00893.1 hypothetical protein CMQ_1974 [Grosmannia clavigera kw1407]